MGDEDGLRSRPGGQAGHLGHRVTIADHQLAAAFAQLFPEHRDGLRLEPRLVPRHGQRRVHDEEGHDLAGAVTGPGQRGVVVNPQIAGEKHDGGIQFHAVFSPMLCGPPVVRTAEPAIRRPESST